MIYLIRTRTILFALIIFIIILLIYAIKVTIPTIAVPITNRIVIIDAGHGGGDPGAVGERGTKEKEINLNISLKLQQFIEQSGGQVMMTRVDDSGLGTNKREDMKVRKHLRDESNGNIFVSIHLNSFPQESCKGAQVFYGDHEESKKLAEKIQKNMVDILDKDNARVAKRLTDVYLLKDIKIPSVIVECGFLSNSREEKLLQDELYQSKLAMAIYLGINEYFNTDEIIKSD